MTSTPSLPSDTRLDAVKHIVATVMAAQKALKSLAPEYGWAGLANLLGSFGELAAITTYGLTRARSGADGYDATTQTGQRVQIKTNHAASQIGFRGKADLLLVLQVADDGTWNEIYYGPFEPVLEASRYSSRDNKHMIAIAKLKTIRLARPEDPAKP